LLLKSLGPGVITGAADDDPSGIATYSVAGAQFGTKLLWTALLTWPLMAAVQMMCARIGKVTGQGLGGNFKQRFPSWLLRAFIMALLAANTINIAADLAGMADAAEMLSGINSHLSVVVFALLISWATVRLHYHQANTLKWLVLVLFAYPMTAFVVGADWSRVLHDTLVPSMPHTRDEWSMLVAILGTTISPYLFFWQASEEVEEEKATGQNTLAKRRGATLKELELRNFDVGVGTFFSNTVMFFIILTTAITLNRHGITHIETTRQAAEALRPLAGKFAATLFTLGIVGVGFLAIPTLAGSTHTLSRKRWGGAKAWTRN
jgi:NRAMP (natural resistance-associated macrophage protein)-like metal ion transporter